MKQAFLSDLLSNAAMTADSLMNLPWQVWVSSGTAEFVTSDTPVSTASFKGSGLVPGVGFGVPGVLVFFPLSPNACLVMGNSGRDYQPVRLEVIDSVNRNTIMFARMHVFGRSRSLKIDDEVQRYVSSLKFGENAFVVAGDYLAQFKQIIASQFGLTYPTLREAEGTIS